MITHAIELCIYKLHNHVDFPTRGYANNFRFTEMSIMLFGNISLSIACIIKNVAIKMLIEQILYRIILEEGRVGLN